MDPLNICKVGYITFHGLLGNIIVACQAQLVGYAQDYTLYITQSLAH